ncbi:MAG: nucleotidyl transferase AbiEii/AbiGii toxin family protein [Candidatus Firestonebacteria bacterium]
MKMALIDRAKLEVLNKRGLRYNLQDAEKDYVLSVLLKIIYESSCGSDLVFKGGTALYHCYFEQVRFSSDLDFTAKSAVTVDDFRKIFSGYNWMEIKDVVAKKHGYDIILKYSAVLSQPDSVVININTKQKVLLEAKKLKYRNKYDIDVDCLVMDEREIFAEKIRTLNERAKPRDCYDLSMLKRNMNIDIAYCLNLIKRKESYIPIKREYILKNLEIIISGYDKEMKNLYYAEKVPKEEAKKLVQEIAELV